MAAAFLFASKRTAVNFRNRETLTPPPRHCFNGVIGPPLTGIVQWTAVDAVSREICFACKLVDPGPTSPRPPICDPYFREISSSRRRDVCVFFLNPPQI